MRSILLYFPFILTANAGAQTQSNSGLPSNIDWKNPVYQNEFNTAAALADFVLEGGKKMQMDNGHLVLSSEGKYSTSVGGQGNHLVAWLKPEMPADFYIEFDFRPKNKQQGLAILFFNARGLNGESVFDPSLPERKGNFKKYHTGKLNNYHISYWAGDRESSNLRKNKGFTLLTTGEDPISKDTSDAFHRIGLYKSGGAIRYYVDGKLAQEYFDDGKKNGPVWDHSGWFGFRQMDHAHFCEYDNLVVYPLIQ